MTFAQLTEMAIGVVDKTVGQLPPEIRTLAAQLPVHYDAGPSEQVIADGFEPDILGLFTGSAHGEELTADNPAPPQILLYLESLWDFAEEDVDVFREEVRLTYLHELGHYLGWDEDEVAARGLE